MISHYDVIPSLAFVVFLVSGCSNKLEPTPIMGLLNQTLTNINGSNGSAPAIVQKDGFFAVPSVMIAAKSTAFVSVVLPARKSQALLTLSGQSKNFTTWLSVDRASFTFINGTILVRTSGLGNDLQNAELSQLLATMRSGKDASIQRVNVHLSRDFQQERKVFACDVTLIGPETIQIENKHFSTHHFEETCNNQDEEFLNSYWVDRETGLAVQSIQNVHPNIGLAYFQLINY